MFAKRNILITGASSGIGRALARRFARDGARLILVARRGDRLRELSDELGDAVIHGAQIASDLTVPGACEQVVTAIRASGEPIDVLVNNAGVGEYGEFASKHVEDMDSMMRLNMTALVRLTHAVVPEMISRRSGRILNIASTAAFQPTPYMSVYGATKAFVLSFSASLWYELKPHGIGVTCVCPGPVSTEFFDRGGYERQKDNFSRLAQTPESLAEFAHRALSRGKVAAVPGAVNRIGAFGARFAPLRALTRMTARLLKPLPPA